LAGRVRFRCARRCARDVVLADLAKSLDQSPLKRPAAAMFFAVVRRSSVVVGPIFTTGWGHRQQHRLGWDFVRKAPGQWPQTLPSLAAVCGHGRPKPLPTALADGWSRPSTGCSLGKSYTPRASRRIVPFRASRCKAISTASRLPRCSNSAGTNTQPRPRPRQRYPSQCQPTALIAAIQGFSKPLDDEKVLARLRKRLAQEGIVD
jgi:hypothetical protein